MQAFKSPGSVRRKKSDLAALKLTATRKPRPCPCCVRLATETSSECQAGRGSDRRIQDKAGRHWFPNSSPQTHSRLREMERAFATLDALKAKSGTRWGLCRVRPIPPAVRAEVQDLRDAC